MIPKFVPVSPFSRTLPVTDEVEAQVDQEKLPSLIKNTLMLIFLNPIPEDRVNESLSSTNQKQKVIHVSIFGTSFFGLSFSVFN